ncbi:adenosylmethionine--8-amino-7-oxononanoate transaminase [Piscinibacter terrae]|uniref:Adenosylmethionine-8-amino-7-oxononanoate aminotransferase n=1 Tax=Piscinibacter terrae TaxID=2496871 RepID=A0A3N7HP45_9BURK|nr:adenosylmethionine--8-amino-7-oxononanoate transaminase [Albitalea terrae]RQP23900.1 adenosylmethionine--8-amino-7-oxononanoate transaminase [Albitalea terrae]
MTPTRNQDLLTRSRRAVWHPCTQMKHHESQPLVPIVRAEGAWLFDADGNRILDAVSSWWVNLFGHGHPHIKAALHDQVETLDHVMLAGLTHEPVIELSERLSTWTGLGHSFYGSDGASATEIALKMSAHSWRNLGRPGKNGFVSLAQGYHGETVGALGVTDIPLFRTAYGPLVRPAAVVMSPDARRAEPGASAKDHAELAARELEAWLEAHHEETAAIILEPLVQCAAGMAMHDAHYLRRVRALCDRFEVHLIADEIATGFGRTGERFACDAAGIRPDFICLSKGLTGGTLPLSVVLTTDAVYDSFYDDDTTRGFLHSHSYTGNPLACRAALAATELLDDAQIERNRATAQALSRAARVLDEHPRIAHARHLGMIWAWDVQTDDPTFSRRYHRAALAEGLLLRPIGRTLYFMPPYVIDEEAIEHLVKGAMRALDRTLAQSSAAPTQPTQALA